jgi:hypothetical protein
MSVHARSPRMSHDWGMRLLSAGVAIAILWLLIAGASMSCTEQTVAAPAPVEVAVDDTTGLGCCVSVLYDSVGVYAYGAEFVSYARCKELESRGWWVRWIAIPETKE